MPKSRLEFDAKLRDLLGSNNLYFQPPASTKLHYPCIVYSLANINVRRANNAFYTGINRYDVQVIDKDPDSEIPMKLLKYFPMSSYGRTFVADNLNHFNLTIFY